MFYHQWPLRLKKMWTLYCPPLHPSSWSCLCCPADLLPLPTSHYPAMLNIFWLCKYSTLCQLFIPVCVTSSAWPALSFHPPSNASFLTCYYSHFKTQLWHHFSKRFSLTVYHLHIAPCAYLWHCTYSAILYFYLYQFNNTQTKANIFFMQHGL